MNSKQRFALAIGGGIIAVTAAVGVGAFAANLATSGGDQPGSAGSAGYGQGGGFGRGGQQFDTTTMATQLAAKLGVDETKVKTALDNALKTSQPSGAPSGGFTPGAQPSGGMPSGGMPGGGDDRRTERLAAMATSIASELNLDEAKVLAALEEVMTSSGAGQASGQPSAQTTK